MDAARLLSQLGRRADAPSVEALFAELRTRRRPELAGAFHDWVLVRRHGVELGFVDEAYHAARERQRAPRKGTPLVLDQVYFYTARDDIETFAGELPFGIAWSDTRPGVRQKLTQHEATRRSRESDTWDARGYRIAVSYGKRGKAVDSIVCVVPKSPWPEAGRVQPRAKSADDWTELLGETSTSARLLEALSPLDPEERSTDGCEATEVDFTFECGLGLSLVEARRLAGAKAAGRSRSKELALGAVRFFRSREEDAREWLGELPCGLLWDDTWDEATAKVGKKPTEQDSARTSAFARWRRKAHDLQIVYDTVQNRLTRVFLTAPGF